MVDALAPERKSRAGNIKELVERPGGKVTEQLLYRARNFSRGYTEQELDTLQGLTITHALKLLTVKDKKRRDRFRQQCQKNNWSFDELDAQIKEKLGKRSQGGRPFVEAKEAGPHAALGNMLKLRDMWQNKCAPKLEQNLKRITKQMKQHPDDELVQTGEPSIEATQRGIESASEGWRTWPFHACGRLQRQFSRTRLRPCERPATCNFALALTRRRKCVTGLGCNADGAGPWWS